MRSPKQRILLFICLVLFFDAAGAGLILPVLPDLIAELTDFPLSEAAKISGWMLFTYAATQFVCAPILGALSDRFGRRPVLLVSLLGFSLDFFILFFAPSLIFLFLARFLSGLFGATYAAANAAIVDISTPDERAGMFGLSGAAVGLGFICGPAIGGLVGEADPRLPFLLAGALTFLVCVFGFFVFPETRPAEAARNFSWSRAHPLGSLISISRQPAVMMMIAGLFLVQLANQSYASTWAFYAKAVADWTPLAVGLSVAVYGAMMVLVQGGLAGPVIRRFGERPALLGGVVVGIASYGVLALAGNGAAIYAGVLIGGLSGFLFPASQSLMTRATSADSQGELQGAVTASYSLASMIGPMLMAQTFGAFSDDIGPVAPGAPFVIAVALVAASLWVFWKSTASISAGLSSPAADRTL